LTTFYNKPADYATNDAIDAIYDIANPSINPPVFRILWLSDVNLDMNYVEGASTSCYDESCCHDTPANLADDLKAPTYGS